MILEDFSPMHKEQQIRVISGVRKEAGQVVKWTKQSLRFSHCFNVEGQQQNC